MEKPKITIDTVKWLGGGLYVCAAHIQIKDDKYIQNTSVEVRVEGTTEQSTLEIHNRGRVKIIETLRLSLDALTAQDE